MAPTPYEPDPILAAVCVLAFAVLFGFFLAYAISAIMVTVMLSSLVDLLR